MSTIFALSSGLPPSGVAVIRISGTKVPELLDRFGCGQPTPRQAVLRNLRDPESGDVLDQALVIFFPAPASFTGEDVTEFHVHGGRAVINGVLEALNQIEGVRAAEPGEFTRRAFEAGRMDLAEVEGLADLISADTNRQRAQALRQMGGGLSERCALWRGELIKVRAAIEADFDFSEEEDVPEDVAHSVADQISRLRKDISAVLSNDRGGEIVRDGFRVALMGPPNAGKSSLLNFLVKRDAAIVTEHAGTTRDLIEVRLDLDGFFVVLMDTAGIRTVDDPVEQEGIRRAWESGRDADLVLWLVAPDVPEGGVPPRDLESNRVWVIDTKTDLLSEEPPLPIDSPAKRFSVSVKTGEGISELLDGITEELRKVASAAENVLVTRLRHRDCLSAAIECLGAAVDAQDQPLELVAEHLRAAGQHIGRIVGVIDVEDLLDHLFREFCIGK